MPAPSPLLAEPDLARHVGFIFAEEDALKRYLDQISVPTRPDSSERTKVGVWFRYPEGERQIQYPFITIDLLSAEPNYDLWTSTYVQKPEGLYRPSFAPYIDAPPGGWDTQGYQVRDFLSWRLIWQVSHFARSALHDRYLTSLFATDILPARPFWIVCPADNTFRRTEILQMVTADSPETTESGTKRIFRKIYTISMLAEIPQDYLYSTDPVTGEPGPSVVWKALRVLIPVVAQDQFDSYFQTILDGHLDPLNEFTREERAAAGEYNVTVHEGHDVPAP